MAASKKKKKELPTYNGPSLDDITALSDEQAVLAFDKLDHEPKKQADLDKADAKWIESMFDNRAWPSLDEPPPPLTAKEILALREYGKQQQRQWRRHELFNAYFHAWIGKLSEEVLWKIVAEGEGALPSISERRYTTKDKLRDRAASAAHAAVAGDSSSTIKETKK